MKRKLSSTQMYPLFRGLALLLHAGVPLSDGAHYLAEDSENSSAELCRELGRLLDEGESLSDAMTATEAFPAYVTGLVRVGESSGKMEQALESLAAEHERRSAQNARLRMALSYPALLLVLVLVVLVVLLTEVLPVFEDVYASFGIGLTGLAGGLLSFGENLGAALPWLAAVLVLIAAAVLCFVFWDKARAAAVKWWQKHFGHKGSSRALNNARFASSLAMALQSGLAEDEALSLAGELLVESPGAFAACQRCRELYEECRDLAEALKKSGAMPESECRLLALGLRSGRSDEVCAEIARRLDEQAQMSLERTTSRIEPAIVLLVAVMVGVILLSVMLPLLDILTAMG